MKGKTETANAGTFAASYESLIKNQQTFDTNNYKAEAVSETRKKGKVIRLFRCFDCDRCFSARMMSSFLVICKNCLIAEQLGDERSRQRLVEKTLNKIGIFLRRRI